MISMFVCTKCARIVNDEEKEKHYEKCLDKIEQMRHYSYLAQGGSDYIENEIVVVRGLRNLG
jgi:predicted metal-binding protein